MGRTGLERAARHPIYLPEIEYRRVTGFRRSASRWLGGALLTATGDFDG